MTQKHGVIFGNLRGVNYDLLRSIQMFKRTETTVLMKFWNAQNVTIAD